LGTLKSSLNQDTLKSTTTDDVIRIAHKTGYDAIEFAQAKIETIMREEGSSRRLVRLLEDQIVAVASVQGPEFFNLLSEKDFGEVVERAKVLADVAREVGTDVLVPVPSFVDESVNNEMSRVKIESSTALALQKLAKACGDDTRLGLEFLGFRNCSINSLQSGIRVIDKVGLPNVGLTVDTFHMHLSQSKVTDLGKIDGKRIVLVHVNDSESGDVTKLADSNRLFLGDGVIDLERFRDALASTSYDGYVSLELLRPEYWEMNPEEVARKGREGLRKIFKV
jgi:2-keto-myo-inositol isomerase